MTIEIAPDQSAVECYINVFKSVHGFKPRSVPTDAWELEDEMHRMAADIEYQEILDANPIWEDGYFKGLEPQCCTKAVLAHDLVWA